jgi:amidohydrolase
VLKNPEPTSIIGQHVLPQMEAGKVGFRPGMFMASTDEIYVTVKGKGGHGAIPHNVVDPILITAHMLVALQQVVSRKANPITPTVLTFGKMVANGSTNIIPDEVYLEGTFRTMDEEWRSKAHELIKNMAKSIAEGMGGSVDFEIRRGYPYLVNDEELTMRAFAFAKEYMGDENVIELESRMTGEDFAYYSQVMPACFYRLGTGNAAKGITSGIHTSTFDIDEGALQTGMGLMAYLAVKELEA